MIDGLHAQKKQQHQLDEACRSDPSKECVCSLIRGVAENRPKNGLEPRNQTINRYLKLRLQSRFRASTHNCSWGKGRSEPTHQGSWAAHHHQKLAHPGCIPAIPRVVPAQGDSGIRGRTPKPKRRHLFLPRLCADTGGRRRAKPMRSTAAAGALPCGCWVYWLLVMIGQRRILFYLFLYFNLIIVLLYMPTRLK